MLVGNWSCDNIAVLLSAFFSAVDIAAKPAQIVFGTIFAGAVHDYLSGMLSVRDNGASLPEIVGNQLGNGIKNTMRGFSLLLMILVGAVFVYNPANIAVLLSAFFSAVDIAAKPAQSLAVFLSFVLKRAYLRFHRTSFVYRKLTTHFGKSGKFIVKRLFCREIFLHHCLSI